MLFAGFEILFDFALPISGTVIDIKRAEISAKQQIFCFIIYYLHTNLVTKKIFLQFSTPCTNISTD